MVEIVTIGDNLAKCEASVIEGETEPHAHTRWSSAAIIHYTGNGSWRVGVVPDGDHDKWEWFTDLTTESVGRLIAATKFRLCPTDELEEKLDTRQKE